MNVVRADENCGQDDGCCGDSCDRWPAQDPFPGPFPDRRRPGANRLADKKMPKVLRRARPPMRNGGAGSFCRHFRQMVSRSRGKPRLKLSRRDRLLPFDLVHRLPDRLGVKRWMPGQERVKNRAQRIDVCLRPNGGVPTPCLLGSHVARGAEISPLRVCPEVASTSLARPKSVILGTKEANGTWGDVLESRLACAGNQVDCRTSSASSCVDVASMTFAGFRSR